MRQPESRPIHLLDYLMQETGCLYLSDLRRPTGVCWIKLTTAVELLPTEEATLQEWNAALSYIAGAPLELTAERAKARLLRYLNKNEV